MSVTPLSALPWYSNKIRRVTYTLGKSRMQRFKGSWNDSFRDTCWFYRLMLAGVMYRLRSIMDRSVIISRLGVIISLTTQVGLGHGTFGIYRTVHTVVDMNFR
jgi:hypothetical protein